MRIIILKIIVAGIIASAFLTGCNETNVVEVKMLVDNIPEGEEATVIVYGPGDYYYESKIMDNTNVTIKIKPGMYKVIFKGITTNDGTLYIPTPSSFMIEANPNKNKYFELPVIYKESGIVKGEKSSNVLIIQPNQIINIDKDYIDLKDISNIKKGMIIKSGPLPGYMTGFLRKVLFVENSGSNEYRVYTKIASFAEAYPNIEIKMEKEVSDYETAAALAIYDQNNKMFNINIIKAMYLINENETITTQNYKYTNNDFLPIVGMDDYNKNYYKNQWLDDIHEKKKFPIDKELCVSTISKFVDDIANLGIFKNIENITDKILQIKKSADRIGIDPCIYIEGQGRISFNVITFEGLPVYVDSTFFASWVKNANEDENEGIRFGFKIKTKSYKSKYSGDIPLVPLPLFQYDIETSDGDEIPISLDFVSKVHVDIDAPGQAGDILNNGLNLIDIHTYLKRWASAYVRLINDSGNAPTFEFHKNWKLHFTSPKVDFLTDQDHNLINSFELNGEISIIQKLPLYLFEPMFIPGTLEPIGITAIENELTNKFNADLACAKDPWWNVNLGGDSYVNFNLNLLGVNYKIRKNTSTIGPWSLSADPVLALNTKNISIKPGEVKNIGIAVYGPMQCLGPNLNISIDNNEDLPLKLITKSIKLNYLRIPTEKFIKIRADSDAKEGVYTIKLKIIGNRLGIIADNVREYSIPITVLPSDNHSPTASLSANPTSGTAPLTVSFTLSEDDKDHDPLTCTLDFGDGEEHSGCNNSRPVPHTYKSAGTYTARYTVTDNKGAKGTDEVTINVSSGGSTNENAKIDSFTLNRTVINDGEFITYSWQLSDKEKDPIACQLTVTKGDKNEELYHKDVSEQCKLSYSHLYRPKWGPGTYTFELLIHDSKHTGGGSNNVIETRKLIVKGTATNHPPTANISAHPTSGTAPLTVNFTLSEGDTDHDPLTCTLDFGDGSTYHGCGNTSHTYTSAGSYTARYTVTDGKGGSDTDTVTIKVDAVANNSNAIVDSFTVTPTVINEGETITVKWAAHDEENDTMRCQLTVWNEANGKSASIFTGMEGNYCKGGTKTYKANLGAGKYHVVLVIHDNATQDHITNPTKAEKLVTVKAVAVNQNAYIKSFSIRPSTIDDGQSITYSWEFKDPEGDKVACLLTVYDDNGHSEEIMHSQDCPTSTTRTYKPKWGPGKYHFSLTIHDSNHTTPVHPNPNPVDVTVRAVANAKPVIDSFSVTPLTVNEGGTVTITWRAHDPENDTMKCGLAVKNTTNNKTFTIFNNSTTRCKSGTIRYTPRLGTGEYIILFVTSDDSIDNSERRVYKHKNINVN